MKSELTPLAQKELSIEIVKFYSLFLHDIKSPPEWVLKVIILSRKIAYQSDIITPYCHKHHLGRTIVLYTPIVGLTPDLIVIPEKLTRSAILVLISEYRSISYRHSVSVIFSIFIFLQYLRF